jgi:hypothetical protein
MTCYCAVASITVFSFYFLLRSCGAMVQYVTDKRADGLLATLADLADSRHAVVRIGVVDGLTAFATVGLVLRVLHSRLLWRHFLLLLSF